jgi:uncharacterized protein
MSDSMVVHHPERFCFTIDTEGTESILQYQLHGQRVDFTRTYVPAELRGKGLAEKLVRHGLAWAKTEQFSIEASCWYVSKFL